MGIKDLSFEDIRDMKNFCEKVLGLKWVEKNKSWPPKAVDSNQGTLAARHTFSEKKTFDISSPPTSGDVNNYEAYCRYVYIYIQWFSEKRYSDDSVYRREFCRMVNQLMSTAAGLRNRLSINEQTDLKTFADALEGWRNEARRSEPSAPPQQKPGSRPPAPKKPAGRSGSPKAPRKPPGAAFRHDVTIDVQYRLNSKSKKDIGHRQAPLTWTLGQFVQQIRISEIPRDATDVNFVVRDDDVTADNTISEMGHGAIVDISYKLPKTAPKPKNPAPRDPDTTYRYTVDPSNDIYLWTDRKKGGSTVSDFLYDIYDNSETLDAFDRVSDLTVRANGVEVALPKTTPMSSLENSQPLVIKLKKLTFNYSVEGDTNQTPLRHVSVSVTDNVLELKKRIAKHFTDSGIGCKTAGVQLYIGGGDGKSLMGGTEVRKLVKNDRPCFLRATVEGYSPSTAAPDRSTGFKPSRKVKYLLMDKEGATRNFKTVSIKDRGTFRDLKKAIYAKHTGYNDMTLRIYDSEAKNKEMNDDAVVADQKCKLYYIMIDDPATSKKYLKSITLPKERAEEQQKEKAGRRKKQPKEQPEEQSEEESATSDDVSAGEKEQNNKGPYTFTYEGDCADGLQTKTVAPDYTIKNFKTDLAAEYDTDVTNIKILFAGKDLLDNIVISQFNPNPEPLFVYLRNTNDIFLKTAKALQT